jgi:hypothetical protein
MDLFDLAGLLGAASILAAFGGVQVGKLDPHKLPALVLNLVGAGLVLLSLTSKFNLAAFLLEAAWAVIAAWGLVKLALKKR